MAEKKIDLFNPVGEVELKDVKLAHRPKRLEGLTLGILDNSKHNALELFFHTRNRTAARTAPQQ